MASSWHLSCQTKTLFPKCWDHSIKYVLGNVSLERSLNFRKVVRETNDLIYMGKYFIGIVGIKSMKNRSL